MNPELARSADPGSLSRPDLASTACGDEHCLTCGDIALPATVRFVRMEDASATVLIGEDLTEVDITLAGDVQPGDILLVHAGIAIARMDAGDR